MSRLNDELQWAMSSAERDDLFGGGGGSSSRKKGDDMMSGKPRSRLKECLRDGTDYYYAGMLWIMATIAARH